MVMDHRQQKYYSIKRQELEAFFDFVHSPPASWVGESVQDRFKQIGGQWLQNEFWRPFAAKISKEDRKKALAGGLDVKPDKRSYLIWRGNKDLFFRYILLL